MSCPLQLNSGLKVQQATEPAPPGKQFCTQQFRPGAVSQFKFRLGRCVQPLCVLTTEQGCQVIVTEKCQTRL